MKWLGRARILDNQPVGPGIHALHLSAPPVASAAAPGQFVHIKLLGCPEPLLRRPYSIMLADAQAGRISLLVQARGRGSRMLCAAREGEEVDLLGPLGRPFPMPGDKPAVLLAGGVGAAPLIFLADRLASAGAQFSCIYGARNEECLVLPGEFAARCQRVVLVTEDGSAGAKGLAVDFLEAEVERIGAEIVYACGPRPMLKAAFSICQRLGVRLMVSLEERMGCGVGACLGCAVPLARGGYARVCSAGPVFDASALDWQAMADRV